MEEKVDTIIVSKCMQFRIKPTKEQKILIWKTFGCCRFVWNHLLDERIGYEKVNKGGIICLMNASAMRRLTKASSSILLLLI